MPHNQDDQHYPGPHNSPGSPQRSSGQPEGDRDWQYPMQSGGSYAPQHSPARNARPYSPPGNGGNYPLQPTPGVAAPQYPQQAPDPGIAQSAQSPAPDPQGQLFLGQSRAERAETPQEARQPVVRAAPGRSPLAALLGSDQEQDAEWDVIDYVLVAGVILLAIAVVVVFAVFFHVGSGVSLPLLPRLLIGVILYAGCVGAGILWGRYQINTAATQENEHLRQENQRLRNERNNARGEVQSLRAQLAAATNSPPPPAQRDLQSGYSPAVTKPKPIERVQPAARIYDVARDPEEYEQDRQEFPHEKCWPLDGGFLTLTGGWRVFGASRRGYGHAYEGKYREDDFSIVQYQTRRHDVVLTAIADGVSSKDSSRFGARAAVLGATDQRLFDAFVQVTNSPPSVQAYERIARALLLNAMQSAYQAVQRQAQALNLSPDELQSTLLVFLAAPLSERQLLVASAQVGDGAIFALQPERSSAPREQWTILQRPQIQQFGNEVLPFMNTSREMWEQVINITVLDNATFIMGMTDGTADDIEPPPRASQGMEPDPFVFIDDFGKRIQSVAASNGQPAAGLLKFLGYQKKGSTDDRTVVCLYRQ